MAGIKRHSGMKKVWTVKTERDLCKEERQLKKIDDLLSKLDNDIEEKWKAKIYINERRYETLSKIYSCVIARKAHVTVVNYWKITLSEHKEYLERIKENNKF